MAWWTWLLLGLILLFVELLTPGGFYLMFFGISALLVGLLTALGFIGPAWTQWLIFSGVAVAAVALIRRRLMLRMLPSSPAPDIDSMVGETAVAMADIAADDIGKAELRGTAWNARNVSGREIRTGQRCKVERVEGLMLWIRE
ncbi:MAG: NfeD family protein [Bryobacteraceae bacterium]